jgi:hypothetical protein
MSSVCHQYTRCSIPISSPQVFVHISPVVFTHVSPQGPGLLRCKLRGAGSGLGLLLEWVGAVLGVWSSCCGSAVGSQRTASVLESTLPLFEPMFFCIQGIQWLLWLFHNNVFFFYLSLQFTVSFARWKGIAPVTCVYVYAAELGGRLRALINWPAHLSTVLVLEQRPKCWPLPN